MWENLICEACHTSWYRLLTRGPKPRLCDYCKFGGVRLRPKQSAAARLGRLDTQTLPSQEPSDCTVRALASAANLPYHEAYRLMEQAGRRPEQGAHFNRVLQINQYRINGYEFTPRPIYRAKGLNTLLARNPQLHFDTYVLQMPGHVATLRDGILIDSFDSSRKQINKVWKVTHV